MSNAGDGKVTIGNHWKALPPAWRRTRADGYSITYPCGIDSYAYYSVFCYSGGRAGNCSRLVELRVIRLYPPSSYDAMLLCAANDTFLAAHRTNFFVRACKVLATRSRRRSVSARAG